MRELAQAMRTAGGTTAHIDIRGKRAVHHRRTGLHDLRQCHHGENFRGLLHQGAGNGRGTHRAGERERRDAGDLSARR